MPKVQNEKKSQSSLKTNTKEEKNMYHNSKIEYKYQPRNSEKAKKNKKRRTTNKSKEVKDWEDMPTISKKEENKATESQKRMVWVPGTISMKTIREMPWGDLNELTDEEYGYFKIIG